MAKELDPSAPLIAETGGLNAMIVDSTALPEQTIADILASAFQSAGQRCSALRVLYLQDDIAEHFLEMLFGAMDELQLGDPQDFATDVGPVIDQAAKCKIEAHITTATTEKRLLKQLPVPETGTFVGPAVLEVSGIEALDEEIFGPVLHIARFAPSELDKVIDSINSKGFGLTFGLHSRIDDRVQHIVEKVEGRQHLYQSQSDRRCCRVSTFWWRRSEWYWPQSWWTEISASVLETRCRQTCPCLRQNRIVKNYREMFQRKYRAKS